MPERASNTAFLSLGSNIDAERNLPESVRRLSHFGCVRAVSRVWESLPAGDVAQANFLNGAILLETPLSIQELKETAISEIERALLRVRDPRNVNAPRTIDVDISLFNRETVHTEHRTIPDPEILSRPFVAIPLAELAPEYVHPETGETLQEIAGRFDLQAWGMRPRDDVQLQPFETKPAE